MKPREDEDDAGKGDGEEATAASSPEVKPATPFFEIGEYKFPVKEDGKPDLSWRGALEAVPMNLQLLPGLGKKLLDGVSSVMNQRTAQMERENEILRERAQLAALLDDSPHPNQLPPAAPAPPPAPTPPPQQQRPAMVAGTPTVVTPAPRHAPQIPPAPTPRPPVAESVIPMPPVVSAMGTQSQQQSRRSEGASVSSGSALDLLNDDLPPPPKPQS